MSKCSSKSTPVDLNLRYRRTTGGTQKLFFLGNTRVTFVISIKKPGFTAFWYFIYRVLFLNKSIFRKLAIFIVLYYCNLHAQKVA